MAAPCSGVALPCFDRLSMSGMGDGGGNARRWHTPSPAQPELVEGPCDVALSCADRLSMSGVK
jgi:hypothetical protein